MAGWGIEKANVRPSIRVHFTFSKYHFQSSGIKKCGTETTIFDRRSIKTDLSTTYHSDGLFLGQFIVTLKSVSD